MSPFPVHRAYSESHMGFYFVLGRFNPAIRELRTRLFPTVQRRQVLGVATVLYPLTFELHGCSCPLISYFLSSILRTPGVSRPSYVVIIIFQVVRQVRFCIQSFNMSFYVKLSHGTQEAANFESSGSGTLAIFYKALSQCCGGLQSPDQLQRLY